MKTKISTQKETFMAYKCQECGALSEDVGEALYECGNCGTRFNRDNSADGGSHKCPDCNKFSSKVADFSCVECEDGEVAEVTAYKCDNCEEIHLDGDECPEKSEGKGDEQLSAGTPAPIQGYGTEIGRKVIYVVSTSIDHCEGEIFPTSDRTGWEWREKRFPRPFIPRSKFFYPVYDLEKWKAEKLAEYIACFGLPSQFKL